MKTVVGHGARQHILNKWQNWSIDLSFVFIHFGWQNFHVVFFCSFIFINGNISILPIDESNWTLHYNIHNTYPIPTSLGDCWSHIQINLLSWKFSTNQNTYNVRAKLPCRQLQSSWALTFFSKLVEMRKIKKIYSIV